MAEISIVVTTYNRPRSLRRCLQSVSLQTLDAYECIVVNDYPDGVAEVDAIVQGLSDSRFRVLHNEVNRGGNYSRNRGIRNSGAAVVAFLDDDDEWMPTKLARHLEVHTTAPEPLVVYSNTIKHWPSGRYPDSANNNPPPEDVHEAIGHMKFGLLTSATTVDRHCLIEVGGFDESLPSMQDWDLWFRLSADYPVVHIEEVLVKYYEHDDIRVSRNYAKRMAALNLICDKHSTDQGFSEVVVRKCITRSALLAEVESRSSQRWLFGGSFILKNFGFVVSNAGAVYLGVMIAKWVLPEPIVQGLRSLLVWFSCRTER